MVGSFQDFNIGNSVSYKTQDKIVHDSNLTMVIICLLQTLIFFWPLKVSMIHIHYISHFTTIKF
jgi:hypothetical protein